MDSARKARLGRAGEGWVADLMANEGWTVLARNFRRGPGELDLVAVREGLLAVVEVKTWRKGAPEDLEHAIGRGKRRKMVETTKIFIATHRQYSEASVRYDVVLLGADGSVVRYEGAFTGET